MSERFQDSGLVRPCSDGGAANALDLGSSSVTIQGFESPSEHKMIISRFAPSPSYYPHLGHLRGLLILKKLTKNGKLYLRLDDTGEEDYRPEYAREFLKLFTRYKIPLAGVITASKRLSIYMNEIKKLIKAKKAYVCDCPNTEDKKYRTDCNCKEKNKKWSDLTENKVIRLISARQADYVILRYNSKNQRYSPTLAFQSAVDDVHLKINHLFRGSDLESSELRLKEIYEIISGKKFPITQYWGRISIIDEEKEYQVSKSARTDPNVFPGIKALQKEYPLVAIEKFLISYGSTKSPIKVDLRKLKSFSRKVKKKFD